MKRAILDVCAVNEAMNQLLLEHLPEQAWRAEPPGEKGRTVAAIFSHLHNDRLMWLKVWGKPRRLPRQTSRHTVTKKEAARALARSGKAMAEFLAAAVARDPRRIKSNCPDAVACMSLTIVHDAHHRGQLCLLTRQLGYRLPNEAAYGIWQWGKLWKQLGIARRWPMP